ncbi:MAG: hypothetical protein QF828_11435, partial [Pseudomonadales bacterium]|nr:hypothetical protein [Pseudomonadales bacterium]
MAADVVAAKPIDEQTADSSSTETSGGRREAFATVKQRFSVDENAIKGMSSQFVDLAKSLDSVNKQLDAIISKGPSAMDVLGGIAGASGGGAGGTPIVSSQTSNKAGTTGTTGAALSSGIWAKYKKNLAAARADTMAANAARAASSPTPGPIGAAVGGGMKRFGKWMATAPGGFGSMTAPAAQLGINAMNWTRNRYQSASDYMLTSDRTGMLLRQMYGGTQLQYQRRYRESMTNALIGNEGIEQMLNLQLTTGLGRTRQQQESMLSGVEGIRVASGFGYSTEQATQMISAMAQPGSSNMMTMMLGMGM